MVQLSLTGCGLSETFILVWLICRAWLEKLFKRFFHFFKTVIKVFKVFAPYLKNEAVNQLKANFICSCFLLAVCAHFERHLPPSLWTMVLQTIESVSHFNL